MSKTEQKEQKSNLRLPKRPKIVDPTPQEKAFISALARGESPPYPTELEGLNISFTLVNGSLRRQLDRRNG